MVFWPTAYDDDATIPRIDSNITELGDVTVNALRDAVFALQAALGLTPSGSLSSLSDFLNVSFNSNGTIKASALTSVGLATLPIVDNQVASNAAIKESKLDLDYSTSDLHTQIVANVALANTLATFTATINADLLIHIQGGQTLTDGSTPARHVASHIDLNAVPSDSRDPLYIWTGLKDKDGTDRSATHVAAALLEVNNALTTHENLITNAHPATSITVDPSNFTELSQDATTVQKALDEIDDAETLRIGVHRQEMHSNGVPRKARSTQIDLDGYNDLVVPATKVQAFLVKPPATYPVDDINYGDDVIKFIPTNTNFLFDSQFTNVRPGDHLHINYGNGLEAIYLVDSTRYEPGSEWFVRINGYNLFNTDGYDAYASIYRPLYDTNTYGVLAVASANNDIDSALMSSLIVGHPRGATALGLGFDANQLDSTHYNLWLQFYPSGNPTEKTINLPAIDVTGNAGATPGQYTIDRIVHETNNALRAAGFNYRFIAFNHKGEFGIMLADPIGKASFAIINGSVSGSALAAGTFSNNVIDDITDARLDALGFGSNKSKLASPSYTGTFASATAAANLPTRIITPLKSRHYIANGVRSDTFAQTYLSSGDGYWPAQLTARTPIGVSTVEVTYTVNLCLEEAKLKPGKTIVVQPTVAYTSSSYRDADYGRFIIKDVAYTAACGDASATTVITVINGLHAAGAPVGTSSSPTLDVKLYFGEDSVSVNDLNMVGGSDEYNRLFEVYINESGETFAHERARMVKQAETAAPTRKLQTIDYWNIKQVSPKLRGYVDDSATNFRKYIRFYVLSYNSTTGEFDGYIGKRDEATTDIYNTGPITTARKNIPAKFYDETGIDYIELEFNDLISGGNSVMSTNIARYVDIEVFSSLQLDDEVFLLATCEFDNKVVEAVVDRRDFGNTSEDDFTTSALNYISAADQALHSNGVVRGLAYAGVDSTDSSLIVFNGGTAIVNGKVVSVNNGKARIPQIRAFGSSTPATVNWAVCVNENGQFEPIIITTSKTQYYATTTGIDNYYVSSATFAELVSNRKDLTVIAMVTATIASVTLSVVDARKFVANETANIPLTWVPQYATDGYEDIIGHFNTFESLQTWVNNYGGVNNTVKVRGTFAISSVIDLSDLTKAITFDGENALFNVTASRCFLLGNNQTFKGLSFNYSPVLSYTAGDVINAGNGCLYADGYLSNVTIERCSFDTPVTGQIAPMINIYAANNAIWTNIVVRDNIFETAATSQSQAAIAFTNANSTGETINVASGIKIYNNQCSPDVHGIYLNSVSVGNGLVATNCSITGNNCAVIGYMLSGKDTGNANHTHDCIVSENTCQFIANLDLEGDYVLGDLISYGSGLVKVLNNRASWVHVNCSHDTNDSDVGDLLISGNSLLPRDSTFVSTHHGTFLGDIAIYVSGPTSASGNIGIAKIHNNTIKKSATDNYSAGGITVANPGSVISGNTIAGAYGASVHIISASSALQTTITGNQLSRSGNVVLSYINCNSSTGDGLVVDNILDDFTVNDISSSVIINAPATWVVERNKNQTVTLLLRGFHGTWAADNGVFGSATVAAAKIYIYTSDDPAQDSFMLDYPSGSPGIVTYWWEIPLYGILPHGVTVTDGYIVVESSAAAATTGSMLFEVRDSAGTGGLSSTVSFLSPGYSAGVDVALQITGSKQILPNLYPRARIYTEFNHSATSIIKGKGLSITYRW